MADVEKYIDNRKKRNLKLARNFESGYEAFEFSVMLRDTREKAGMMQDAISLFRRYGVCNLRGDRCACQRRALG